jgi:PIN domain nuclease of toxin-antitoxin system
LDLLIDTQILVWLLTADRRMSNRALTQLQSAETNIFVSAVTAWEYSELRQRKRLPVTQSIADLQELFGFDLLAFPSGAWRILSDMPNIHRDPMDRMLIAHAICADLILVSADADIQQYPVKHLW